MAIYYWVKRHLSLLLIHINFTITLAIAQTTQPPNNTVLSAPYHVNSSRVNLSLSRNDSATKPRGESSASCSALYYYVNSPHVNLLSIPK